MHLGMSGSFRVEMIGGSHHATDAVQEITHERHDHVLFRMSSGAIVTFNDPRRFGLMDLVKAGRLATHPVLSKLGPEPLADDFDGGVLARACAGKRTALKVTLLDQRVVAGLGNIYASEALNLAGLSPFRKASTIATSTGRPRPTADRLAAAIKSVLTTAIERVVERRLPGVPLPCLRPHRRALPDARLRRHDPPGHPGRPHDLLLPELPAVVAGPTVSIAAERKTYNPVLVWRGTRPCILAPSFGGPRDPPTPARAVPGACRRARSAAGRRHPHHRANRPCGASPGRRPARRHGADRHQRDDPERHGGAARRQDRRGRRERRRSRPAPRSSTPPAGSSRRGSSMRTRTSPTTRSTRAARRSAR